MQDGSQDSNQTSAPPGRIGLPTTDTPRGRRPPDQRARRRTPPQGQGEATSHSARRARGWALTVHYPESNEHAEHAIRRIWECIGFDPRIAYCCMQFEACPETGRRHCQGYLHWKGAQRFSAVRSFFEDQDTVEMGIRPHIEVAIADAASNIDYCSKPDTAIPDTFVEFGTRPQGQGTRYRQLKHVLQFTVRCTCSFLVCVIFMLLVLLSYK